MKDKSLHPTFQNWDELSEKLAHEARLKRVLDEGAARREAEIREQEARIEEKEAIARRLLKKGMDVEEVVQLTELAEKRVIEIQKEMEE